MNKIYKHVTNTKNGKLVSGVAGENARTTGSSTSSASAPATMAQGSSRIAAFGIKALTVGMLSMFGLLSHAAAPVGVVAHGQASLVTSGTVLNVNQSSQAATINFQQLNLGAGEGVAVQARSVNDITLFRVAGGMNVNGGFITANNNLLISSPNGIAVSNGGKVSAQGEVYMTTQDMAVGQYTKPTHHATSGAMNISGQSQISASNIVLDAGSVNLSNAKLVAMPASSAEGIRVQGANIHVQDSSLSAKGGKIAIGIDTQGNYANSTRVQGSTLLANAVEVAGKSLHIDNSNSITAAEAHIQTVDLVVNSSVGQLISSILQSGANIILQGDNSVTLERESAIAVNSAENNTLRILTTGSTQNNPSSPDSPTPPIPNQVAILGTINLNGGRKSLLVHSAGDLNLDGTIADVSGDSTFQAMKTIIVNGATISTVGDLTIGRDAFGQGALSHHTVVFESALTGYNIETSGDTLTTQGVTARTTGGQWLLDPTDINITNAAASTGGTLASALAAAGTSTINTADIVNAINAGSNVNVVGTGTITLSSALTFSIASGLTGTLTLDNRGATSLTTIGVYTGIGINIKASITNNGAGTVNLNFLSAGSINVNNSFDNVNKTAASGVSLRSTSGKLNITMQSTYATNTNGSIFGSNIYIYGNVTTRGGFITLDGTGGSIAQSTTGSAIAGETITAGTIENGAVYVESYSNLNTVSDASTTITSATTGGNVNIASSRNRSTSAGAFEQGVSAPIRSGGQFNLNTASSGAVVFNFVTFGRETNSGIYTAGDINIISTNTSTAINPTSTGVLNFTSPIYSYGGTINITNTSTAAGVIGINALNAIIGRQGVNIVNNSVGQIGINTRAPATAVVPPGGSFSSTNGLTSITNTSTGAFAGIYLRGTVSGKDGVEITNTSESGTTTSSGVYIEAAISSSAGSILIDSTTTTGTAITYPTTTVAGAATAATAFNAVTGISIIGTSSRASELNAGYAAVSINKAAINTGAGGITMQSTGNIRVANVTDQGTGDIDITGGFNIASGTITGGTILGVGTLSNTGGGVISLSMAAPTSTTGGAIETAAGVTTTNASVLSNVSYGNVGGVMGSVDAGTVNTVNYRSVLTGSTVINLEVENYSQVYGTAYNDTIANNWLANSSNVIVTSIDGSSSGFGVVSISNSAALASLRFASNLGVGGNSNLVQSATDLSVLGAITSSYGTVSVTARAGKNTYTITPKELTITGSTAESVYDGVSSYADVSAAGTTYSGLVTSIGGVATGDAVTGLTRVITTAANTTESISGVAQVGSYVDTLSNAEGTGLSNYTITYAPGAFSVTPAALTITGGSRNTTYNAAVQNNATYTVSGLLGTDTVTSVTGVASGTTVGVYNDSLSAAQGTGLSNYTISYTNGALTIGKAALTITSAASSSTYTGAAQTGLFTVSGLQGSADAVAGISGAATGTNAGTYTSTLGSATGTGLENYEITYTNTGTLTITKANATITGDVNTSVYNGSVQTNTGAVIDGLLGNDANTVSVTGYAQATNVAQGIVVDNLSATGVNASNYEYTITNGSLRITPKALTVVGAQTTVVYNATTRTNTSTITGLVTGDAITVSGSASARNVSTINDALSVAFTSGDASNYTTTITDGFLKITPAIISISGITAADKIYDGSTTASLSGSPTITGILGTDAVSVNTSSLTGAFADENAGTNKTVLISGIGITGYDAANYQLSGGTTATTTADIDRRTLTVTGTSLTTTYNGGVQSLTAPVVDGLVTGDNVTIGGNATGTNAGAYNASYTASGSDAGNYSLVSPTPAILTIEKAALVVTADNNAKFVTQNDPSQFTAQVSGFQGTDTASGLGYTYTISREAGENAGSYAITPTGVASLTNYDVSYVAGQFTISPAGAVLIKMNPTTSTYGTVVGGTIESVQYVTSTGGSVLRTLTLKAGTTDTYTDGFNGEITITPTTTVTATTGAGTYAGAISNTNTGTASSSGNFSAVETIVNTAVVNQASLTLTMAPVTKTYDGTAFTPTGVTVTPTGLMNGQTLEGLGGLTYSGTAIGAINASTTPYSLAGSVGSGFSNYNVTIAPVAVTINKAPLQITGGTNTYTFNNTTRTNTYSITGGQLYGGDSVTGLTGLSTRLHAGSTVDNLTAAAGVGLSNYNIAFVNGGLTITPAQITAIATPTSAPVYNGSTTVANTTMLVGVIGGTLVSGTTNLTLSGDDVGLQTITNGGTTLSGANAGDYVVVSSNLANTTLNQVTPISVSAGNGGGTVTITPAPLTITGGTASYVFNNTQRTNTYSITSGTLYSGDTLTGVSGLATGLRASSTTYADNLSGATGLGIGNYAITYVNKGITITPAPLTALSTPVATTYSGGTSVANTTVLSGIIAGTTVSGTTTLTLGSPNAGTQTITNGGTVLSGDNFSDYYVVSSNLVGTGSNQVTPTEVATGNGGGSIVVAKAPLSITGDTSELVYNGTAQTNAVTITGLVNNEVISTTGSAQATNVAQGVVDDQLVLVPGSVNLDNYAISITNGSLLITPAVITISGITAENKVYDATNAATLNVGTISFGGVLPIDSANVSVNTSALTGEFIDENAALNKTVYISGISIEGTAASNYRLSGGTTATTLADITKAPLTISGLSASGKVYDGTTDAVITGTPVLEGVIAGESVSYTGAVTEGDFVSPAVNVRTATLVTADFSAMTLSSDNYYIQGTTSPLSARISPLLSSSAPPPASSQPSVPVPPASEQVAELTIERPDPVLYILPPTPPVFVQPLDEVSDIVVQLNDINLVHAGDKSAADDACGGNAGILFGFDSAVLSEEAKEQLRQCRFDSNQPITISGFTDGEGASQYNMGLAKRRAMAVADFIASEFGISRSAIQVNALGKANPVDTNSTQLGRAKNRRVQIRTKPVQ